MKTHHHPHEKVAEHDGAVERGYEGWKRAKIERGMAQAQYRESLIPMDRILRDFGV